MENGDAKKQDIQTATSLLRRAIQRLAAVESRLNAVEARLHRLEDLPELVQGLEDLAVRAHNVSSSGLSDQQITAKVNNMIEKRLKQKGPLTRYRPNFPPPAFFTFKS